VRVEDETMISEEKALDRLRYMVGRLRRNYNSTNHMIASGEYADNEHTRSFKKQYREAASQLIAFAYSIDLINEAGWGKMARRISNWYKKER
jgi:hypothetical protein